MNRSKSSGFTLIEMLVGLVLFSFILVMLYSGLFSLGKSFAAGTQQTTANDDARLTMSFLRKCISQTAPLIDADTRSALFSGEQHSLVFVSSLPARLGGERLYLIRLQNDISTSATRLQLYFQPLISGYLVNENQSVEPLFDDIKTINFSYFGKKQLSDEPSWHKSWTQERQLPQLIKLTIESSKPNKKWSPLLFSIPSQTVQMRPHLVFNTVKTAS